MDSFIGEIRIFAGNFAPMDWAFCNGQILSIAQNSALYAVIGPAFGGDGRTTFALPDLRDKVPVDQGQGLNLTNRVIGTSGGSTGVTLSGNQLPNHGHTVNAQTTAMPPTSLVTNPNNTAWVTAPSGTNIYAAPPNVPNTAMSPQAIQATGGGQAHTNKQPYLGMNFIIALSGVFPARD